MGPDVPQHSQLWPQGTACVSPIPGDREEGVGEG